MTSKSSSTFIFAEEPYLSLASAKAWYRGSVPTGVEVAASASLRMASISPLTLRSMIASVPA